jgi:hypothetical protein
MRPETGWPGVSPTPGDEARGRGRVIVLDLASRDSRQLEQTTA